MPAPDLLRLQPTRRGLLALAASSFGARLTLDRLAGEWTLFRRRHVTPEGRVVDDGNLGISHSEGQAYGLLMAARCDDRETFERLLAWTVAHLARPGDQLAAWRHRPGEAAAEQDRNNATDGDLGIAWALSLAAERWKAPAHRARAQAIARDILRVCTLSLGDRLVLLPGAQGFAARDRVTLNLSYYHFPALSEMARIAPDPAWARLIADGLLLLRQAQFGRWRLPADWIDLPRGTGRPGLAPGWPPRFSYDALRIPLNLAWAGLQQEPALRAAAEFWADPRHRHMPGWADLRQEAAQAPPAGPAIQAVAGLSLAAVMGRGALKVLPLPREATDYYGSAICMMAHFAWEDLGLSAVA